MHLVIRVQQIRTCQDLLARSKKIIPESWVLIKTFIHQGLVALAEIGRMEAVTQILKRIAVIQTQRALVTISCRN